MLRLAGKTAVVTGAGIGIGRAIAQRFSKEGASVLVVDRDTVHGPETVELVRAAGGKAERFAFALGDGTVHLATFTDPEVAGSRPPMMFSRVLLPQPLGPMRQSNSPRRTSSDTSSRVLTCAPSGVTK